MKRRYPLLIPFVCLGLLALGAVGTAESQTAAGKRPLTHNDHASWRFLQGPTLSPDGTLLAYAVAPQEGDGELVTRDLRTGKESKYPRGSRQGAPATSSRAARGAAPAASPTARFSPDGKFVLFTVYPTQAERDKARKGADKGASLRNALGIMETAGGKLTRIERVRTFEVPEEGPAVVAYLLEPRGQAPAEKRSGQPADKTGPGAPAGQPRPGATTQPTPPPPPPPSELVLRHLADGRERTIKGVTDFSFSKDGQLLVYTVGGRPEGSQGVYVIATGREEPPTPLRTGAGRYTKLTWDEKQKQLAFFHVLPAAGPGSRGQVKVCHWTRPEGGPAGVVTPAWVSPALAGLGGLGLMAVSALPQASELATDRTHWQPGYEASEQGDLAFSADGSRLYFGVAPAAPPPARPLEGEDQVVVELWHHQDDFIQPMQKVRYDRERQRTYRAVLHLADKACRQLANEEVAELIPAPAGDWALGLSDRPYRHLVGRDAGASQDFYLVNTRDGSHKPLLKKQSWPVSWSPAGKYNLYYDGKDWHSIATATGKDVNLTAGLGVSFSHEDHDSPSPPPAHGLGGWTRDDGKVLLYDRYDIWAVSPDGSGARNLTGGVGRKSGVTLRVVNLDPREKGLDPAGPLLARAEDERTRDTGFYRVPLDGGPPKMLIMGARNYGVPVKARKADTLMLTVSTFYDYPDLFVTGPDFRELRKVTDANPQKAKFVWGKAELVRYKNADGVPLQGVLIKPENFEAGKKYPMIVYIYERLSDGLHQFRNPGPGTSINPTYYASNGYLVLLPDIVYTVGYPGQSAQKCVLPAIQAVVDQGCVKEDAIGIQGHSWGGYQTAYLVTQTTRFKAAAAGAPVVNMTSAYGGIRWGTGLPRQFQYEHTQSRIGGTLWQFPTRFLENSPLFQADRVKTPLLMLHNDRDDAVPWQQGIEYYLALRRLGKEVYLFNYPGEAHGLRKRANMADYTVRMQQFFDHHLKGAPKPAWMEKGIPYTPPPQERNARPGTAEAAG